jgi:hypothetical protein
LAFGSSEGLDGLLKGLLEPRAWSQEPRYPVTAPTDAHETSLAYFAMTPDA